MSASGYEPDSDSSPSESAPALPCSVAGCRNPVRYFIGCCVKAVCEPHNVTLTSCEVCPNGGGALCLDCATEDGAFWCLKCGKHWCRDHATLDLITCSHLSDA